MIHEEDKPLLHRLATHAEIVSWILGNELLAGRIKLEEIGPTPRNSRPHFRPWNIAEGVRAKREAENQLLRDRLRAMSAEELMEFLVGGVLKEHIFPGGSK